MPEIAFALPVQPGKEELDRDILGEIDGDRRGEHEAAMREAGITRHAVWHQETPDGTVAVVYIEAQEETGIARFASSDAPFNRWFREQMIEVHGVDIAQAAPPPQKLLDHRL